MTEIKQGSGAPNWDALFAAAQGQAGYFTTAQAAAAGYSPQLLHKYLQGGRVSRIRRGIHRLVHFPAGDNEDLVVAWLWSERLGVFSHETALALHDLSDGLPSQVEMTVPATWRSRRLRVPPGLVLHYDDLGDSERTNSFVVPITQPGRTLRDCIDASLAPDLIRQAILQARRRGLISSIDKAQLESALELTQKKSSHLEVESRR